MNRIRAKLTYANVMSSIAAFGVLAGGGAYAQQRIGTSELRNGAVTTPKIASQAVGTGKLKRRAVGTGKVKARAIGTGKLKPNAVGTGRLKPGAVNTSRLADGAVDVTKILDGAIQRPKIANDAVGPNELADRAVVTTKISPGAVGSARLADEAVTRAKLHDNMRPYWAVVGELGDLERGRGTSSVVPTGPGAYDVAFERDVSDCSWLVSLGSTGAAEPQPSLAPATLPGDLPHVVQVRTWDEGGVPDARAFHLSVVC